MGPRRISLVHAGAGTGAGGISGVKCLLAAEIAVLEGERF